MFGMLVPRVGRPDSMFGRTVPEVGRLAPMSANVSAETQMDDATHGESVRRTGRGSRMLVAGHSSDGVAAAVFS